MSDPESGFPAWLVFPVTSRRQSRNALCAAVGSQSLRVVTPFSNTLSRNLQAEP